MRMGHAFRRGRTLAVRESYVERADKQNEVNSPRLAACEAAVLGIKALKMWRTGKTAKSVAQLIERNSRIGYELALAL
jgi:hypothetical protein